MNENIFSEIYRKFIWAGATLAAVIFTGTAGYWFIGDGQYSLVDCMYMTVITIATIGYGEIIDMAGNPAGRIFTIVIALLGIGTLTYILSNFTAFVIEGDLNEAFRRRKMEKKIRKYKDHYIVCGIEGVGLYILGELFDTEKPHVIVDIDLKKIEKMLEAFPEKVYIAGDATDTDTLIKAGAENAKGLFAATGDDNQNLVISLTAKQINPNIRVIARCHDLKNEEKMKKAGADSIVLPAFIGGLRMASEMIRPTVVSFLDVMLRDKKKNLRIEEIPVPASFIQKSLGDMNLKKRFPGVLILALRTKEGWIYNPLDEQIIMPESALIIMTTPEEYKDMEKILFA